MEDIEDMFKDDASVGISSTDKIDAKKQRLVRKSKQ
jgi:hypothetical protein